MKYSLRVQSALLCFFLILGTVLRVAPLSHESLDGDEMFSAMVATGGLPEAFNAIKEDLVHPPVYYLALRASLPAYRPYTATDLRMLSLFLGVASIAVVFAVGMLIPPLSVPATLAALLLTVSRTHVYFSQEARSYSLYVFCAALLLLWGLLLDRKWRDWKYWVGGAALMILIIYVHYYAAFYIAALVLAVLISKLPRSAKVGVLGIALLALATFTPWLLQEIPVYRLKSGLGSNLAWQGTPSLYDLCHLIADFLGVSEIRFGTALACLLSGILALSVLLSANLPGTVQLRWGVRLVLFSSAFFPPLAAFLLTRKPFQLPIFGERHLLASLIPTLLLAALGLHRLSSRAAMRFRPMLLGAGSLLLVLLQVPPLYGVWRFPARIPYADIAARLGNEEPLPIYTTWFYGIGKPASFYLRPPTRIEPLPADSATLPARFFLLYRPAAQEENNTALRLLQSYTATARHFYTARGSASGTELLRLERNTRQSSAPDLPRRLP